MTSLLNHVPKYRNLVVSLVLGIVISCEYCMVSCAVPPRTRQKGSSLEPITLDNYLNGDLRHRDFAGQWAKGSDNLVRIFKPDTVVNYNVESGEEEIVLYLKNVTDQLPPDSPFTNIIFSNDGNYALIEHGRSSVWRYSALAKYDIFDINTGELTSPLAPPEATEDDKRTIQFVKWSPTGNGIAFVYKYNIYYKADARPDTPVRQITSDGEDEEKAIYNGICDWVYEEEMFGGPNALWISKSGKSLAFVKFNDSEVEEFQWPMYGEPGSNESIYPKYRKIRYPKTGTPNPKADVYIISLTDPNSEPVRVTYPETTQDDLHIIGTAMWASETELIVATLNREQTVSQWHLCSSDTAVCRQIYTYKLDHGWVDMNTPKVSDDGQKFIFIQSVKQSKAESFKHIVMFMADKTSKTISSGRLSVESILGWDEPNRKIYFSGSFWDGKHADPSETQIYSVGDTGENTVPKCITCGIRNSANNTCRQNSVMFSDRFTRFIHRCLGPDVPETTTRYTEDGRTVEKPGPTFISNSNVRDALAKKAVPLTREYEIPVGDNFIARARLYLPPDFDESKKYPLLISVYGGPGSQNLHQIFGIAWETSLVSDRQVIFGNVDGRGVSGSSTDHLFTLHRKLGTAEVEDQITVAKYLIKKESFIDGDNTAIWGWSYGGFVTARVLETDVDNVFKCGISVAPVTNWRYYDTIYTERFMGLPTPEDNLKAYEDSDVTRLTSLENLRNKQYMLIHGNADDNVHYQQSMIFARALEQADIYFHQLSYPDENHGIAGPGMRKHLYHSLERFLFDECYKTEGSARVSGSTTIRNSLFTTAISFIVIIYKYAF